MMHLERTGRFVALVAVTYATLVLLKWWLDL